MIAQDIVNQLAKRIPLFTDGFSTTLSVVSIVPVGTTATLTTASAHGIIDGQNVSIIGAQAPVQIDTATFTRTGSFATIETLQDHDLTLSERDKANGGKSITISGANEPEFNGEFSLLKVLNRRKVTISVADSGPVTITGSPLIENANGGIFNGLVAASNITATTFDYELPISYPLPAAGNPKALTDINIVAVLDVNQYLNDVYTKQVVGKDQLVVQLGDVSRSKSRSEETDASDSALGEDGYNPTIIQSFAVYIVQNVTDLLAASPARDKVESEYIPAILQSLERASFDSGFSFSEFKSIMTAHGVFAYAEPDSKNKALYVHEVTFEQLARLDKLDTVGSEDTVAMRNVDYSLATDLGTGELTADVDLDEERL